MDNANLGKASGTDEHLKGEERNTWENTGVCVLRSTGRPLNSRNKGTKYIHFKVLIYKQKPKKYRPVYFSNSINSTHAFLNAFLRTLKLKIRIIS